MTGSTPTFLHHDKVGSIIAVSNNSGAVANKNKFSPFGEITTLGGTTVGFTGQRYDSELGLYYFKRRYYSPKLGRFLQPDPIGYTGRDFNLYTYVSNSPIRYVDPMGLQLYPGETWEHYRDRTFRPDEIDNPALMQQQYDIFRARQMSHQDAAQDRNSRQSRFNYGIDEHGNVTYSQTPPSDTNGNNGSQSGQNGQGAQEKGQGSNNNPWLQWGPGNPLHDAAQHMAEGINQAIQNVISIFSQK